MTHPNLPGQPIWVNRAAVPVLMASRWEETPEPPKPPKPAPADAPTAGDTEHAGTTEITTAGRRRPSPKPITDAEE